MARRILLLLEDASETSRLEVILKKIGFDTSSLSTEVGLTEKILGFRPELIVVAGQGVKLSAVSAGQKLKEMRAFSGSVVMGIPKERRPAPQELLKAKVDRLLETPFDAESLIRSMCELLQMDAESHVEKLRKFSMGTGLSETSPSRPLDVQPPAASVVKITSKLTSAEREARFRKYTQERASLPLDRQVSDTTFKRTEVRDKWADVKKDWDPEKLAEQDALKREFTKALFSDRGSEDKDSGSN